MLVFVAALLSLNLANAAYSGFNWVPFTVSDQAVVTTDFSDQDMERFYVKMPCQDTVWFKLFLNRDGGQNSHVEIFSRVKGNIYCNDAGSKSWWGGEKTDFTMDEGAMKCEAGDEVLIIIVEKTADRVTIKNRGQTLYNQAFSDNDANCRKATTQVKTQVWNYAGSLHLGVFDNSYAQSIDAQDSCFVENFDYGQADIKKITKVDSAETCYYLCRRQAGCLSMAFVPGNGDCWLKNLMYGQNPKPKVGVISTNLACNGDLGSEVDDGYSGSCIDLGVDYWGADIKNMNPIYTIEECTARCQVEEGCVALTHRPSTQDCWLKNKRNGQDGKSGLDTVNSINMMCFLRKHLPEDGCVKENYDFRGADIRMVQNVLNVEDCAALCIDEDGCVSVTHQPSTSRCWLKNKEFGAEPQDMDGVSSRNLKCGDVWCEHAGSFLYTYANKPVVKYVEFEDAKRACVENDACKGITQEPYSGNKYTLRRGPTIHDWSPTNETSWTLCDSD